MDKKFYDEGVHEISNTEYHNSQGFSRSALMLYKKSPLHYWHRYLNEDYVDNAPTDALILGDLVHTMVLEPLLINERYVIEPEGINKRTKAGKEEYAEFLAKAEGKTVVTPDMSLKALAMSNAVNNNEVARSVCEDALMERSIFFEHKETGIMCKVRPDIWNGSVVGDLKTTADASPKAFQSSCANYGYFLQAGMIHEALASLNIKMERFVFVAVENKEPHAVGIYVLDDDAIDYGVCLFNSIMSKIKVSLENKTDWPGYGVQELSIPKWLTYEVFE